MNPLHSPLGLRARLRPAQTAPCAAALVAVLLLAIVLSFAGSRHIFAPGVAVTLIDETDTPSAAVAAPAAAKSSTSAPASAVAPAAPASATPARPAVRAPAMPRSATPLRGEVTDATLTVPVPTSALLSVRSDTMVFFEGRMFPLKDSSLRAAMARTVREAGAEKPVLLLKMDGSVTMNRFFQLRDYALEAGFTRIVIAAEDSRSARKPKENSQ